MQNFKSFENIQSSLKEKNIGKVRGFTKTLKHSLIKNKEMTSHFEANNSFNYWTMGCKACLSLGLYKFWNPNNYLLNKFGVVYLSFFIYIIYNIDQ